MTNYEWQPIIAKIKDVKDQETAAIELRNKLYAQINELRDQRNNVIRKCILDEIKKHTWQIKNIGEIKTGYLFLRGSNKTRELKNVIIEADKVLTGPGNTYFGGNHVYDVELGVLQFSNLMVLLKRPVKMKTAITIESYHPDPELFKAFIKKHDIKIRK